ncbi:MAG: FHA domain-containing protein [Eubacterium sp.]|nr:FHA domain-containing protein [Eubacterium sp.]
MMILQKTRGVSNYMEICDICLSGNYEEKMLTNNDMKSIPTAEIREVDNEKSIFYKIDGLCALSNRYGRCVPDRSEIDGLIADLIDCIGEIKEYLLSPDGLVINLSYILYDEINCKHKFMYVPGYKREFKDQIKLLFEEIMRMFNHGDREGVIYLYEMYSNILMENFTPELFCKMRPDNKESGERSIKKNFLKKKEVEEFLEMNPERDSDSDMYKGENPIRKHRDHLLYILASMATVLVAAIMYIFFGVGSLKFSGLTFAALAVYVLVDMMHKRREEEMEESMKYAINKEEHYENLEENSSKGMLASEVEESSTLPEFRDHGIDKDTSVLAVRSNADGISKLVPCDEGKKEIYLIEGETRIGRSGISCDYCIDDPSVSRVHVIIEKHGQEVTLMDVGSTNGTFINDTRVNNNEEERLSHGDLISFANVRYECV